MSIATETLSTLSALRVVQATVAAGASERAGAWLRAVESFHACPADVAVAFRTDAAGQRLMPIAAHGIDPAKVPAVPMADLDHPLVYSLVRGEHCFLDAGRLDAADCQSLLTAMRRPEAMLALPLRTATRGHANHVLLFGGTSSALRALRADDVWMLLVDLLRALLDWTGEPANDREPSPRGRSAHDARQLEDELPGASVAARRLRAEMAAAAESSLSVLITGETGAGKDHAAWLIHRASSRRDKAFVPLNCAAVSPELIAAELFGSAKGAYTGADRARPGLVAAAHGGTLFLDEIGDMPLPLQAALLRLLNEKRYRPLGEIEERTSDFRLLCATHQPLPQRIREGRFREDLYYRIRQLALLIPPLRERRADIGMLSEQVIARHNREHRASVTGLSPEARSLLVKHDYPGNIRELISTVRVACERTGDGEAIGADALRNLLVHDDVEVAAGARDGVPSSRVGQLLATTSLSAACHAFERELISARLRQYRGSRALAARSLGIPHRTLSYKCKKLHLDGDA